MPLATEQVNYLAALARLKLTAEETQKFAQQLNQILDYFNQFQALNIQNVRLSSQTIDLLNVMRPDEIKAADADIQINILNQAPQKSGRYFKVNKVF